MAQKFRATITDFTTGLVSQEISARGDIEKIKKGLLKAENWNVRSAGGIGFRDGMKYLGELGGKARLMEFTYSNSDGVVLIFMESKIQFMVNGEFILVAPGGARYEVITTYTEDEIFEIHYARYYNDVYLVHPNHSPKKLKRNAVADWDFDDLIFNPTDVPILADITLTQLTTTGGSATLAYDWDYAVCVVDKDFKVGFPKYKTITSDIDLIQYPTKIEFTSPVDISNISKYYVYRKTGGVYSLIGNIEEDGSGSYELIDNQLSTDDSVQPPTEFTDFENNNNPASVCFYGQRLVFGGTNSEPSGIWMSRTGLYEDFTSTNAPVKTESFKKELLSERSSVIHNLLNTGNLLNFSENSIWTGKGFDGFEMQFTPSNFNGAANIEPIKTEFAGIYVAANKQTINDFIFNSDFGYQSDELNLLCRDYFDGYEVVQMSYSQAPDSNLFCVLSNGKIMVLNYLKSQNIFAWSEMTTPDGEFTSVITLFKTSYDETYMCVKRGETYCIEMYQKTNVATMTADKSICLDSHVVKESATEFNTVSGLDHLEGQEVGIIYDGNYSVATVGSGEVTLNESSLRACVGLTYANGAETVPFFFAGLENSFVDRDMSGAIVWVRVKNSKGLKVSFDGVKYEAIKTTAIDEIGEVPPLTTMTDIFYPARNWTKNVSIKFKQDTPFPTIIETVTVKVEVGR